MELARGDIDVESCQGWIRLTRGFFPRCLARGNIARDVGEVLWSDPAWRRGEAQWPIKCLQSYNFVPLTVHYRLWPMNVSFTIWKILSFPVLYFYFMCSECGIHLLLLWNLFLSFFFWRCKMHLLYCNISSGVYPEYSVLFFYSIFWCSVQWLLTCVLSWLLCVWSEDVIWLWAQVKRFCKKSQRFPERNLRIWFCVYRCERKDERFKEICFSNSETL